MKTCFPFDERVYLKIIIHLKINNYFEVNMHNRVTDIWTVVYIVNLGVAHFQLTFIWNIHLNNQMVYNYWTWIHLSEIKLQIQINYFYISLVNYGFTLL